MAEVQDEEQWLYGDDKGQAPADNENQEKGSKPPEDDEKEKSEAAEPTAPEDKKEPIPNDETVEQNGEAPKPENEDDNASSSDDEPTVTIGKIVKQPDIIRHPPPPTHRSAPTSGLKDEDFSSVGKINGITAVDYSLLELEEKPWRKPGADLSDYFNYGFIEDTWLKYCERQKVMRNNESGIGLIGLGINMNKMANFALGQSNIPVSIVNDNSKYGMPRKFNFPPPLHNDGGSDQSGGTKSEGNTIQVMTADRRMYSNKVLSNTSGGYEDTNFSGYDSTDANYYTAPPPPTTPFFCQPPPIHTPPSWTPSVPPPGYSVPPPPTPVPPPMNFFEEENRPVPMEDRLSMERELDRLRAREGRESRHRESVRRRSRSRSRSRHVTKRTRSPSKSGSPSHKHKRKKSKREREDRETSKSR